MADRPLGRRQLEMLVMCSSVTRIMLVSHADHAAAALVGRGLLRIDGTPNRRGVRITAAGLRRLAEEMLAGRVDDAIERIRKRVEARETKRAAAAPARPEVG